MTNPYDEKMTELTLENEKLRHMVLCKRCGFDNTQDLPKIDPNIVKEYYKHILTQAPFKKEYTLFDGQIIVTCTEPNRRLLAKYANSWDILGNRAVQYALDLLCIMLLDKIQLKTAEGIVTKYEADDEQRHEFFSAITPENIESLIPESYQSLSQVLLVSIKQIVGDFNNLCLKLAEAVHEPNFWKGVGHV
jgi:hypothetical protein